MQSSCRHGQRLSQPPRAGTDSLEGPETQTGPSKTGPVQYTWEGTSVVQIWGAGSGPGPAGLEHNPDVPCIHPRPPTLDFECVEPRFVSFCPRNGIAHENEPAAAAQTPEGEAEGEETSTTPRVVWARWKGVWIEVVCGWWLGWPSSQSVGLLSGRGPAAAFRPITAADGFLGRCISRSLRPLVLHGIGYWPCRFGAGAGAGVAAAAAWHGLTWSGEASLGPRHGWGGFAGFGFV